jgi:hypothetical protein
MKYEMLPLTAKDFDRLTGNGLTKDILGQPVFFDPVLMRDAVWPRPSGKYRLFIEMIYEEEK